MTLTDADLGWIGIWLLVVGAAAIVIEMALAGIWSVRITRKSRTLSERLAVEQARLRADVERLRAALAETAVLLQADGRPLGWLPHPLPISLVQSFGMR